MKIGVIPQILIKKTNLDYIHRHTYKYNSFNLFLFQPLLQKLNL